MKNIKKGSLALLLVLMLCCAAAGIAETQSKKNKVSCTPGEHVLFGNYPQGYDGEVYPIEWLVLDVVGNKALLISQYGLDNQKYNNASRNVTWETCSLRAWMNDSFYNKAFSSVEKKAVMNTKVPNGSSQCNSEWNTNGGNDTYDYVFTLSCAEARYYFGVSKGVMNYQSRVSPTPYAVTQGAKAHSDYGTLDGYATAYWWLRSPGYYQYNAARIHPDGSLRSNAVDNDYYAVRPCIWIDLSSDIFGN